MNDYELISGLGDALSMVAFYGGIIAVVVVLIVRSRKRRNEPREGSKRSDDQKHLWVERRALELTSGQDMKWKKAWKQAEREYSMRPTGDGQPGSPVYLKQQATERYEQQRMAAAAHAGADAPQPVPSPQARNTWPKALAIGGSVVVVLAVVGMVGLDWVLPGRQ